MAILLLVSPLLTSSVSGLATEYSEIVIEDYEDGWEEIEFETDYQNDLITDSEDEASLEVEVEVDALLDEWWIRPGNVFFRAYIVLPREFLPLRNDEPPTHARLSVQLYYNGEEYNRPLNSTVTVNIEPVDDERVQIRSHQMLVPEDVVLGNLFGWRIEGLELRWGAQGPRQEVGDMLDTDIISTVPPEIVGPGPRSLNWYSPDFGCLPTWESAWCRNIPGAIFAGVVANFWIRNVREITADDLWPDGNRPGGDETENDMDMWLMEAANFIREQDESRRVFSVRIDSLVHHVYRFEYNAVRYHNSEFHLANAERHHDYLIAVRDGTYRLVDYEENMSFLQRAGFSQHTLYNQLPLDSSAKCPPIDSGDDRLTYLPLRFQLRCIETEIRDAHVIIEEAWRIYQIEGIFIDALQRFTSFVTTSYKMTTQLMKGNWLGPMITVGTMIIDVVTEEINDKIPTHHFLKGARQEIAQSIFFEDLHRMEIVFQLMDTDRNMQIINPDIPVSFIPNWDDAVTARRAYYRLNVLNEYTGMESKYLAAMSLGNRALDVLRNSLVDVATIGFPTVGTKNIEGWLLDEVIGVSIVKPTTDIAKITISPTSNYDIHLRDMMHRIRDHRANYDSRINNIAYAFSYDNHRLILYASHSSSETVDNQVWRTQSFNSPVNIRVYNQESVLIGEIIDNEVVYGYQFDHDNPLFVIVHDEAKVLHFPYKQNYRIEIIATSIGNMDYFTFITDVDDNTRDYTGIHSILLNNGSRFTINPNGDADYHRLFVDGVQANILLNITSGKNGIAFSMHGKTQMADTDVTVTAIPDEGFEFAGWYENGIRLVGAEQIYVFTAERDRILEARFIESLEDTVRLIDIFDCKNLAQAVADELDVDIENYIYLSDLEAITVLEAPNTGIRSLVGVEYLTNLEFLNVDGNHITDVRPVLGMQRGQLFVSVRAQTIHLAQTTLGTGTVLNIYGWNLDGEAVPLPDTTVELEAELGLIIRNGVLTWHTAGEHSIPFNFGHGGWISFSGMIYQTVVDVPTEDPGAGGNGNNSNEDNDDSNADGDSETGDNNAGSGNNNNDNRPSLPQTGASISHLAFAGIALGKFGAFATFVKNNKKYKRFKKCK